MPVVNAIVGWLVDLLVLPFRAFPPLVGLAAVSLVTAVVLLLVFRRTSDQDALAAEKRQIQAAIYEMRLFNDDLRAIFRAQAEVLRRNMRYLRLSLIPMLWVLVPLVLVIAQLQFRYGYTGLTPGEPVLVKAQLREGVDGRALALEAPETVRVETRAVWIPAAHDVLWRISASAAGEHELNVTANGVRYQKTLRVSDDVARRSPVRLERGFLNQVLYPAEAPLPDDAVVTAIAVSYPERRIEVFGWYLHWMVVYFALTLLFAVVLRRPLGVTI